MIEWLKDKLSGKRIVILGYGREGQASYTLLRRIFPGTPPAIADTNEAVRNHPSLLADPPAGFITGADYLKEVAGFEVIIRSPGIPVWHLNFSPAHLTSQTDLFLQFYSGQTIGVTGTKGKSTTASLIHHILSTAGHETILAGNIGNPPFHFIDRITPETHIVMELSSHQLEFLHRGPHYAVLLNLFPEHLDAYENFLAYQLAKLNIALRQSPGDWLIYSGSDPLIRERFSEAQLPARKLPFSMERRLSPGIFIEDGSVYIDDGSHVRKVWNIHQDRFLRGDHNLKNILAAAGVTGLMGLTEEDITDGIGTFKGLKFRLEYMGEIDGIHFYNDSISTIPEACMEAIRSVPSTDTLIAGGFDRGIPYDGLASFLRASEVRNFILVGAAGKRIGEEMEKIPLMDKGGALRQQIFYINRFADCVPIAFRVTRKGFACLMSPAAASYDEFNNFEERGKKFQSLITNH